MSLCPFIPVSSSSSCFSQGLLLIISKALLPWLPCVITLYSTNKVQIPIRHPRNDYSIWPQAPMWPTSLQHLSAASPPCTPIFMAFLVNHATIRISQLDAHMIMPLVSWESCGKTGSSRSPIPRWLFPLHKQGSHNYVLKTGISLV